MDTGRAWLGCGINGPINGPFSNTGDVEQAARQRTGKGEESH